MFPMINENPGAKQEGYVRDVSVKAASDATESLHSYFIISLFSQKLRGCVFLLSHSTVNTGIDWPVDLHFYSFVFYSYI